MAARADPERAQACWQQSLEECALGLILGPFTIADINKDPSTFPGIGYAHWRPLPRFAIQQKGKWRCIDDGAASSTNSSGTITFETIVCDRPDSPLKIGLRFHELGPPPSAPSLQVEMGGGTDDKFAGTGHEWFQCTQGIPPSWLPAPPPTPAVTGLSVSFAYLDIVLG